jgi:hypothetical protein
MIPPEAEKPAKSAYGGQASKLFDRLGHCVIIWALKKEVQ